MTTIEFVYYHGGSAHLSTAKALCASIEQQQRPWNLLRFNILNTLAPLDIMTRTTGIHTEDIYNKLIIQRGWWWLYPPFMWAAKQNIRQGYRPGLRLLEKHWRTCSPDLVVSLIPYFNQAMHDSLKNSCPGTPLVTIFTDFADTPPDFWLVRQDQYIVCSTEHAYRQARGVGFSEDDIFVTSGIPIHPHFYNPIPVDKRVERRRLGLNPDRLTGLVMFGGQGSDAMLQIARHLDRCAPYLQLIFVCGRHKRVAAALRARSSRTRRVVEEFTDQIPYYMQIADFFVGKPGALSISEALTMQLPVITEHNVTTLAQERHTARWIEEHQAGLVLRRFSHIASAVEALLQPGALARYQASVARLNNRAVFEIPEILQKILDREAVIRS
jgi:1,2-diacylglycerol 3-beta-galactosyltransferase